MSIPASYIAVILIWSTTPLGIQWSGEQVGYQFGVASRMSIGLVLLLLVIHLRGLPLSFDARSRKVYLLGGVPLFVAMSSVYWAAQYIPSGWISVVFGLTPIVTSLLSVWLLQEQAFAGGKLLGMLLGLGGLCVVFYESTHFSEHAWLGVLGVLVSVTAHSVSAVLLKRARPSMPALNITTGSLLVATPLYIANLLLFSQWPEVIPMRTLAAIIYLAVVGSAIGFPLYFFLLTQVSAARLALITLVTPVTALLLGTWLNGETISTHVWLGTGFILAGLALYEFSHTTSLRARLRKRFDFRGFQRPM